jgi:hypothetical protein
MCLGNCEPICKKFIYLNLPAIEMGVEREERGGGEGKEEKEKEEECCMPLSFGVICNNENMDST